MPAPGKIGWSTSVRLDEGLRDQVDAFAAQNHISRTEAIRVLLGVALGQDTNQIAAREATMRFTFLSRKFVGKLITTLQGVIPETLAETEREIEADA